MPAVPQPPTRARVRAQPASGASASFSGIAAGEPHHPGYYGQLERQNREHRAWLEAGELVDATRLGDKADEMVACWNTLLPRRSLGWKTAADVWGARVPVDEDRRALREEVEERAARSLRRSTSGT